jgi:NADP-dependent 3-hydroxy acid dehydrogenase YdfG
MKNTKTSVIVTGVSSGFGEGAVKNFVDKGCRVWDTMVDVKK